MRPNCVLHPLFKHHNVGTWWTVENWSSLMSCQIVQTRKYWHVSSLHYDAIRITGRKGFLTWSKIGRALILLLHVETIRKKERDKVVFKYGNCLSLSFVFNGLYCSYFKSFWSDKFLFSFEIARKQIEIQVLDRSTRVRQQFFSTHTRKWWVIPPGSSHIVFRQASFLDLN